MRYIDKNYFYNYNCDDCGEYVTTSLQWEDRFGDALDLCYSCHRQHKERNKRISARYYSWTNSRAFPRKKDYTSWSNGVKYEITAAEKGYCVKVDGMCVNQYLALHEAKRQVELQIEIRLGMRLVRA